MKARLRRMGLTLAFGIIAGLGLLTYIRPAPSDPADWHVDPEALVPASAMSAPVPDIAQTAADGLVERRGVSFSIVMIEDSEAVTIMQDLDAVAQSTARTTLVAGTPEQRHMTWVTRSAFFGFPDYTTAKATQVDQNVQLVIVARQKFGSGDFGVNSSRLANWLALLQQ